MAGLVLATMFKCVVGSDAELDRHSYEKPIRAGVGELIHLRQIPALARDEAGKA